jgi:thiamine biosynthesis lipoprotein
MISSALRASGSILLALSAAGASLAPSARHEFTQIHMGLPVRLVVYARSPSEAQAAAAAAFARVAALDAAMSDYRPESEVSQLHARAGEWLPVSPDVFKVVDRAVEIARLTGGAFDPTVAPLVALWREARRARMLPARTAIDDARARVGWRRIDLDASKRAVRLAPGTRLDLGGIAKGYILQEARATLAARGIASAMIEAGGDIVVAAAPPGRSGWHIEVPSDGDLARRAERLTHAALATSGPTAQFVEIGGIRYSHVVDPRTGLGLTNGLVAHVIADDAATADALATAATVLGRDGLARLRQRFLSATIQLSSR